MTMKNDQMVGSENLTDTTGWTLSDAVEASLEARIESHRYADETDRILSRIPGEDVETLFPSYEALVKMGVEVTRLADALDNGLDAKLFGAVLEQGLEIEGFNQTLEAGIDIPTFNAGMEHLVEQQRLLELHPDAVDRALHRHGECSCVA
ncbi:MAG TPA: hypothetical protein V6D08_17105 [Candidatus Obscuribacterales bacterium]